MRLGQKDKGHVYFEKNNFPGDSLILTLENHQWASYGHGRGSKAQLHTRDYDKSTAGHTVCAQ